MRKLYLIIAVVLIGFGCSDNPFSSNGFRGMDNFFNYQISNELEKWDLVAIDYGERGPENSFIYRYNLPDTSEKEVLADSVIGHYEIKASHDGRYIAYLKDNSPDDSFPRFHKIWIYDLMEGEELETDIGNINLHTFSMKWSPAENKLLITNRVHDQEKHKMYILTAETRQTEEIIHRPYIINPEWSHDGRYISFMEYESFEAYESAIGNVLDISTRQVSTITEGLVLYSNLKWSAAENRLFFIELHSEYFYLSSISRDGSEIERLIKGKKYERPNYGFPTIPGPLPAADNLITIYPDGIYMIVYNFGFIEDENTFRVIVDADYKKVRKYVSNFVFHSKVSYTNDGRISYMRGKYEQETFPHFYVALPNGTQLTPILKKLASGGEVLVPKFN
ncbi:MAG: hypothetical protein LAT67_07695 [Balneolales bacterium]|nr:hypothetical protein [Balneolales bacterium]